MRYKMMIIGVIAVMCAVWAAADYSWHYAAAPEHADSVTAPPVPDFAFTDVTTQRTHRITDFKDKTVLINFWASWCAPCLAEFPKLAELARQHPKTLTLILISEDAMPAKIRAATHDFLALPNAYLAWDNKHALAQQRFQTFEYPETFVVSPNQMISQKIIGEITPADAAAIAQQRH